MAFCAGLLINQFSESPFPLVYKSNVERLQDSVQRIQSVQSATIVASAQATLPSNMGLDDFSHYVEAKRGLILDARPSLFYRLGHVPGALSLPREDFEHGYAALRGKLEANRSLPIVIYCSDSECEDSKLVRDSLKSLGYTNLSLFESGWSAWTETGKTKEASP